MLKQVFSITALGLRSIPERIGPTLVIVVGLAGVVAVFTALLAMAAGFSSTLESAGRTDVATVLYDEVATGEPAPYMPPGRDRVASGLADMLALVRRLCDALAYVHGEGIVHRDLKPSNVIVVDGRTPVLVDFGIVAEFSGASGRDVLDVAVIGNLDREVQTLRERRRRLLRAARLARVDGIHAGDDVDVLHEVGEQLGALPSARVQRRIVGRHRDVGIGMAHEQHGRARPLLEEVREP